MNLVFFESRLFSKLRGDYLDEYEYARLQQLLLEVPDHGDIIQGTGGYRKLRWPDTRRGKGKRGGLRIVYYHFESDNRIWLATIYDKDEVTDLTADEKRALKTAIHNELKAKSAWS